MFFLGQNAVTLMILAVAVAIVVAAAYRMNQLTVHPTALTVMTPYSLIVTFHSQMHLQHQSLLFLTVLITYKK